MNDRTLLQQAAQVLWEAFDFPAEVFTGIADDESFPMTVKGRHLRMVCAARAMLEAALQQQEEPREAVTYYKAGRTTACVHCGKEWLDHCGKRCLKDANGWRPIESAPKDGEPLMLWVRTLGIKAWPELPFTGRWFNGMWIIFNADLAIQRVEPTHWQPLLASPSPKEKRTEVGKEAIQRSRERAAGPAGDPQ